MKFAQVFYNWVVSIQTSNTPVYQSEYVQYYTNALTHICSVSYTTPTKHTGPQQNKRREDK